MTRKIIAAAGVCIAAGFLLASGVANYLFGLSLGQSSWEGQLYGLVGILAVAMNAVAPFFLSWALAASRKSTAAAVVVLWVLCLVYSTTSALGFAAQNRESVAGSREIAREAYDDTRRELIDLEARRQSAKQKDRAALEQRIDAARERVASLRDRRPITVDAQSAFLSTLSMGLVDARHMRLALNALFALMVEIGATLALFAAVSCATPEPTATPRWKPNA